ncbi:MAG: methylenetetrahydrofolate reductase [Desulfobacterales bacterium]
MQLKSKIDSGQFVILAEMEPPKGVDVSAMLRNANRVKGRVDAFIVPEMSNAVMRMSSLGGSLLLQKAGMPTIMQVNCRDRNRLALQADLLAAGAAGVDTLMVVTGEDPSYGDHHEAKAVYDLQLPDLLDVIEQLANGRDMAGIELLGSPKFTTCAVVNTGLTGDALEAEIREMNEKIKKGVSFFITPPVFDLSSIKPFLDRVDHSKTPIVPTVLLLKSIGMARYMARNVKHVHIPDHLIQQLQKAPDKVRECIRIAADTILLLKENGFSGAAVSTIGWENKIHDILDHV